MSPTELPQERLVLTIVCSQFPLSDYSTDIDLLKTAERDKVVKLLRRSEGGYLPGSGRFVGLALLRAMHYDEGADFRTSFDNLPY